jgi:divalent metal cation (Fe/Co/Zn/Cd) transporter
MDRAGLTKFAWLSIAAAIATITLKASAYYITGSVGLLSDALESAVNLVAVLMALAMLTVASRPPDEMHAFGYNKGEFFSSGLEGALIFLAAASIAWTARSTPDHASAVGAGRCRSRRIGSRGSPQLRGRGSCSARLINIVRSRLKPTPSHLMTDVWTLAGVVGGGALVFLTGLNRLGPIIATSSR